MLNPLTDHTVENGITSAGATTLFTKLPLLSLKHVDIHDNSVGALGCQAMIAVVHLLREMERLHLHWNAMGKENIQQLLAACTHIPDVTAEGLGGYLVDLRTI